MNHSIIEKTSDYFKKTITKGFTRSGNIYINGNLSNYPFYPEYNGISYAVFPIEGLDVDYRNGWVPFKKINGKAYFQKKKAFFKAENFKDYYIYLGLGFSIWNTIGGSINAAPNIFTNNSASLMNTNINPLFFVLEEWCFEIQSFLQSLGMVIIFLGILDSQIFINLIYSLSI